MYDAVERDELRPWLLPGCEPWASRIITWLGAVKMKVNDTCRTLGIAPDAVLSGSCACFSYTHSWVDGASRHLIPILRTTGLTLGRVETSPRPRVCTRWVSGLKSQVYWPGLAFRATCGSRGHLERWFGSLVSGPEGGGQSTPVDVGRAGR